VSQLLQSDYDYLRQLMYEQTSIQLPRGKEYVAETRLVPVLTLFDCADLAALVRRLRDTPTVPLLEHVVDALTNHETSWLRDPGLFDALSTGILPELVERRRSQRRLSIWSVGCSTGQEPYSVAMLLDERFPNVRGWDVEILATDVSPLALRRAQEATYSNLEMQRGLPDDWRSRFFQPAQGRWRLHEEIRKRVSFRTQHVLGGGPALQRFDLILLCNVLLYFDDDTRQQALARMRRALVDDGYLVLDRAMMATKPQTDGLERARLNALEVYRTR
jgi:chemotaxis protein methyltransferase CheR